VPCWRMDMHREVSPRNRFILYGAMFLYATILYHDEEYRNIVKTSCAEINPTFQDKTKYEGEGRHGRYYCVHVNGNGLKYRTEGTNCWRWFLS